MKFREKIPVYIVIQASKVFINLVNLVDNDCKKVTVQLKTKLMCAI